MPVLEIHDLCAGYGHARVLHGVDLRVDEGEIVTVIGPNGAGKTTLLKIIARTIRRRTGTILLEGKDTARLSQAELVRRGCVLVPEGRQVFAPLSVLDNLRLGGYVHRRTSTAAELDRVYELFPRLAERASQPAGTLSGGEQQMLAIGRALMSRPRVMLLDEPSLGLAPQLVARIMATLTDLRSAGLTILLVEQNAHAALRLADRGYVLHTGRVQTEGPAAALVDDPTVRHVYLGSMQAEG